MVLEPPAPPKNHIILLNVTRAAPDPQKLDEICRMLMVLWRRRGVFRHPQTHGFIGNSKDFNGLGLWGGARGGSKIIEDV